MSSNNLFASWRLCNGIAVGLVVGLALSNQVVAKDVDATLRDVWRFTHALPAPWGAPLPGAADLTGRTLTVTGNSVDGPKPFACKNASSELIQLPAAGLFQGILPGDATRAALALGLIRFPLNSSSLRCDSGVFDFHYADADTVLIGLDNRVWSLSRAPGAKAAANAAEGVVQRLLEAHFAGGMGFSAQTLANKRPFLSDGLWQAANVYLAKPQPSDEVPAINGGPFTGSQEYPTRFAVQPARIAGDKAEVEIKFSGAEPDSRLRYRLIREADAWRVDDIVYSAGASFRGLMQ